MVASVFDVMFAAIFLRKQKCRYEREDGQGKSVTRRRNGDTVMRQVAPLRSLAPRRDRADGRVVDAEVTPMRTIEQEYVETRAKSRALYEQARRSMPSGVAHDGRAITPFPFYVDRADGPRKWDVDGHAYLDCWSGHGALILGHNHPAILRAITEQAPRGLHYSACHELEVRWAELIRECVPGAERVRFMMTGTETTALAIRLARAATGRTRIIKFRGHFHGVHDAVVSG